MGAASKAVSPIAFVTADENQLGPQASFQRFRCSDEGFGATSQGMTRSAEIAGTPPSQTNDPRTDRRQVCFQPN